METKRNKAFIGSALLLWLIGSLLTDTSLAAERPDFSGNWQLNEELSEDPREKMRERMQGRGGRGGSGGGPGGGGRGGGSGPQGGTGGGRGDMESRSEAMAARIKVLEIIHQEPELTIGFGDGASRTVFTDGRKMEESSEVGVFEGKGKWKGSSLVFNYESLRGKVTETYELNPAGDLLTVTTKMEGDGRRPGVTFARIYDRVAPEIPVEPDPEPAGN